MGQLRHLWNVVLKAAGFPEAASSMEVTLLECVFPLPSGAVEPGGGQGCQGTPAEMYLFFGHLHRSAV